MMHGTDAIFPESHLTILNQAAALFSQQVWYWGQDVQHPRGNILINVGFERVPPPPKRNGCASVYSLTVNSSQRIVLRGFGAFWGDDQKGGLLLLRERFESKYLEQARLTKPCWSKEDFPTLSRPTFEQRPNCLGMLVDMIDWIHEYELNILSEYGPAYRQRVFSRWNDGKRNVLPPEEVPAAWRRCQRLISDQPDAFLPFETRHV